MEINTKGSVKIQAKSNKNVYFITGNIIKKDVEDKNESYTPSNNRNAKVYEAKDKLRREKNKNAFVESNLKIPYPSNKAFHKETCVGSNQKIPYPNKEATQQGFNENEVVNTDEMNTNLLDTYISGLTIHGLSRVISASSVKEKVAWFCFLSAALTCGIYVCYNSYYRTYAAHDIRTEIRVIDEDDLHLPAVAFCSYISVWSQVKCYNSKLVMGRKRNGLTCSENSKPVLQSPSEGEPLQQLSKHCLVFNANGSVDYHGLYGTGIISIMSRLNQDKAKSVHVSENIHDKDEDDDDCDAGKDKRDLVIIFVFDPTSNETLNYIPVPGMRRQYLLPGRYEVSLQKTITQRLPAPYRSKCSEENGVFPGFYSRMKCSDICALTRMQERCGSVIDIWRSYVPDHIKENNVNRTEKEIKYCIKEELLRLSNNQLRGCKCSMPCFEVDYNPRVTLLQQREKRWLFNIKYEAMKVTHVKEQPETTFWNFLAQVGGLIGLLVGMSVLSLVEVAVVLILSWATLVRYLKRKLFNRKKINLLK